jgi:polar amino acid transport system substrate-binding protein
MVFYKRIDQHIIYSRLEDLQNYRIGVERGFAYPWDFNNAFGLQCIAANSAEANIYHLLQGNLDLIIIDKLYAQHILSKMSTDVRDRLESLSLFPGKNKESAFQDIYLVISRESKNGPQVIIDFNYGLKQIKDDGAFERILKKHGIYNEISKK